MSTGAGKTPDGAEEAANATKLEQSEQASSTAERGSREFYDSFGYGLDDWRNEHGKPHRCDMRKMFQAGLLFPGGHFPHLAKLASFNVATELGLLAQDAKSDQTLAESLRKRLDWSRLNDHFSQVVSSLHEYQKRYGLTVDKVRADIRGFPPMDLFFTADDVEWKGQLEVRHGRNMVALVKVTLPCDGFLVSSPTLCDVATYGKARAGEHRHRTYPHIHPVWDKIKEKPPTPNSDNEKPITQKIPEIQRFVNSFFLKRRPGEQLAINIFSCVSEQRVDIEVEIPGVSLVIQFEAGLPDGDPPRDAAAARLWDEW